MSIGLFLNCFHIPMISWMVAGGFLHLQSNPHFWPNLSNVWRKYICHISVESTPMREVGTRWFLGGSVMSVWSQQVVLNQWNLVTYKFWPRSTGRLTAASYLIHCYWKEAEFILLLLFADKTAYNTTSTDHITCLDSGITKIIQPMLKPVKVMLAVIKLYTFNDVT